MSSSLFRSGFVATPPNGESHENSNASDSSSFTDDPVQVKMEQFEGNKTETARPTIRVREGLQVQENRKRAADNSDDVNSSRKLTKSGLVQQSNELETELNKLRVEIKALNYLCRRKEQEWDQVLRLLKQKEEKLAIAERKQSIARAEANSRQAPMLQQQSAIDKIVSNLKPITPAKPGQVSAPPPVLNSPNMQPPSIVVASSASFSSAPVIMSAAPIVTTPSTTVSTPAAPGNVNVFKITDAKGQQILLLPKPSPIPILPKNPIAPPTGVVVQTSQPQIILKPASNIQPAQPTIQTSTPIITSVQGNINQKKANGTEKKNHPMCNGCNKNVSKFVCAGCSGRWYCSRECQEADWDDHADFCAD